MTTNTNAVAIANIEAIFRAKITAETGPHLITVADEALEQIQKICDTMSELCGYDDSKLTPDNLELAKVIADNYSNGHFTGEVVAGVLQPVSGEEFDRILTSFHMNPDFIDIGMVFPIRIITKIITEVKQFRR